MSKPCCGVDDNGDVVALCDEGERLFQAWSAADFPPDGTERWHYLAHVYCAQLTRVEGQVESLRTANGKQVEEIARLSNRIDLSFRVEREFRSAIDSAIRACSSHQVYDKDVPGTLQRALDRADEIRAESMR